MEKTHKECVDYLNLGMKKLTNKEVKVIYLNSLSLTNKKRGKMAYKSEA